MNYITDEFKKKLESIFPKEKVDELTDTFNSKIHEEKTAQDKLKQKFEWSYDSSSPTDLNISIVLDDKDSETYHISIHENGKTQVVDVNLRTAPILYKGIRGILDHNLSNVLKNACFKKPYDRFNRTVGFFSRKNTW